MMKEITCAGCKKTISSVGFYHDETLSMRCNNCNEVIFPTTKALEEKSRVVLQGTTVCYSSLKKDLLPIKIGTSAVKCPSETCVG